MISTQELVGGMAGGCAVSAAFWIVGYFVPGMVVKRVHSLFEDLRGSTWIRDPSRPKRIKWLAATIELLEDEIPEPGQGRDLYDGLGNFVSRHIPVGSSQKWADALQKIGDAIDTELDHDIKDMASVPVAPLSPVVTDAPKA